MDRCGWTCLSTLRHEPLRIAMPGQSLVTRNSTMHCAAIDGTVPFQWFWDAEPV